MIKLLTTPVFTDAEKIKIYNHVITEIVANDSSEDQSLTWNMVSAQMPPINRWDWASIPTETIHHALGIGPNEFEWNQRVTTSDLNPNHGLGSDIDEHGNQSDFYDGSSDWYAANHGSVEPLN